jgi:hypothetical protein
MSAFARPMGNVAADRLKSNGYATAIWVKDFLATVLFLFAAN